MTNQEDLMMKEIEQEMHQEKPKMCGISKNGLTVMGQNIPWVVIILIIAAIFFYLHKQGVLTQSVNSVMNEQDTVASAPMPQLGGSRNKVQYFAENKPSQLRKMMGH